MSKLTNRQRVLNSTPRLLVEALTERNEDYIKELAEELMLDELLCGECDAVEFLKSTMERAALSRIKNMYERRLEDINGKYYD